LGGVAAPAHKRGADHQQPESDDGADRLAAYERQRDEMPPGYERIFPYAVATLEFGITYERAVLQWFGEIPPSLTDSSDAPE
jgi:hypothetical protein